MNLAIFVTADNIKGITSFLDAASTLQKEQVNGCFLLVHDSTIDISGLTSLSEALATKFQVHVSLPVSINNTMTPKGQIASGFAQFLLNGYTRYPGPWLIVDDYAIPKKENFMQEALKQHGGNGGVMTGRGIINPGSIEPMGPVTMEVPAAALKVLRFALNEGWRSRGRYCFGNCGFVQISTEEYLFNVSNKEQEAPKEPVKAPEAVIDQVAMPKKVQEPSTDMKFVPAGPRPAPSGVQFDQEYIAQAFEDMTPINAAFTHPPVASPQPEIAPHIFTMVDFPSKKELLDKVQEITGTRPHHFTKNQTLLDLINPATQPA